MTQSHLDIEQPEQLLAYLRQNGRIRADERVTMRVLAGGVSNRTVLVERPNGERWVLKQALAKLRVAVDWFSDPARIEREAQGLRWLEQLAPPGATVPLIFEDRAQHVLAMQAALEPHDNWKTLLLAGRLEANHVAQFGRMLGAIHREASRRRAEVEPAFVDRSFFESLRVEPYYSYTAGQTPETAAFYRALIDATREARVTLVHGDFSPKNVLVHQDQLILLDHEVIHWGDPAFDLGFALTHLLSKAHHLPAQRAAFADTARLFWQSYAAELGDVDWRAELEARAVRHTLGCLLARVAGRSPLEYLDAHERARQRTAVIGLVRQPPETLETLIGAFLAALA